MSPIPYERNNTYINGTSEVDGDDLNEMQDALRGLHWQLYDDFYSGREASDGFGVLPWGDGGFNLGSGGVANIAGELLHPGIARMSAFVVDETHGLQLGGVVLGTTEAKAPVIRVDALCRVPTLPTAGEDFTPSVGIGQVNDSSLFDSIRFATNNADGNTWQAIARSGGSETKTDTGLAAVAGDWVKFGIVYTPGVTPQAEYYINNVLEATITTNLPTATELKYFASIYKGAGTLERTFDIDVFRAQHFYQGDGERFD